MKLKYHLGRIKFSELAIGDKFEFTAAMDFPYSGFEPGPWVKQSDRKYSKPGMDCEVGTISTEVFKISVIP